MATDQPEFKIYTCAELMEMEPLPPATRYHPATLEVGLVDESGRDWYRVDLEHINTAADMLGWIMHLSQKTWVTPRHLMELIEHAERHRGIQVNYGC